MKEIGTSKIAGSQPQSPGGRTEEKRLSSFFLSCKQLLAICSGQ